MVLFVQLLQTFDQLSYTMSYAGQLTVGRENGLKNATSCY